MSRIYAGGVRATALANIVSDITAFISFNANGEKVLDRDAMREYLIAQFRLISTDAEYVAPATAASSLAAAEIAPVMNLVNGLDNAIGVHRWKLRSDWPTSANVLKGGTMVSAVTAAMTECSQLSDAITNHYLDLNNELKAIIVDFVAEENILSGVPAAVERKVSSRTVVYTYVNDWDEESAPSPASELADLDQNDTCTYTATTPPVGRNINRIRWYRSQSTASGALEAFLVREKLIADGLTLLDDYTDEELLEPCPTLTWEEPPATLQGLVAAPNGCLGGFYDNTYCESESLVPYAWPSDYRKTVGWPIVGVGVFDQTRVVLTRGRPYFIDGADPQSLTVRMIDSNQPCVSRRSIVSVEGGVIYASADGICLASAGGVRLLTEGIYTREQWQALDPSTIIAAEIDGVYHFQYTLAATNYGMALDLRTMKLVSLDLNASAFYRDLITDTLYYASGTAIKALKADATKRTGTWKTPKHVAERPENMAWLQVDSDFEADVTVKLYREGTLTDTKVVTSRTPVRLSAVRAIEHEVQIESAAVVTSVTVCGSTAELQGL